MTPQLPRSKKSASAMDGINADFAWNKKIGHAVDILAS